MAELERVIGKKLFESTWSDYTHPYLIQTFLISVLIAVILEAYLTKKYISKNEVGKRFVMMAMCMGVVIGGIYLSQYIPRFGPTTKSGYIQYLKEGNNVNTLEWFLDSPARGRYHSPIGYIGKRIKYV